MNIHYLKERQSFNALYEEYSARIYGNVLKMVKDPETAQELLQDIFVKVWEKRGLITPGRPWGPYLFQIARNHVCDYFRKEASNKKLEAHLMAANNEAYTHIEEEIIYKESQQLLWRAIEKLSPQRRQVFTLCRIEGKSYFEISHLLGISTSTVSDHMLKASRFIRSELLTSEAYIALVFMLSLYNL